MQGLQEDSGWWRLRPQVSMPAGGAGRAGGQCCTRASWGCGCATCSGWGVPAPTASGFLACRGRRGAMRGRAAATPPAAISWTKSAGPGPVLRHISVSSAVALPHVRGHFARPLGQHSCRRWPPCDPSIPMEHGAHLLPACSLTCSTAASVTVRSTIRRLREQIEK